MNHFFVKISLILIVQLIFFGCNVVKKVPENKYLLTANTIYVNGKETKNKNLYNYLPLQPNQTLLKYPLRLGVYNLSKENADSIYISKLNNNPKKKLLLEKLLSKKQTNRLVNRKRDFNDWLKKSGEAPAIVNKLKIEKGQKKLEAYFWNRSWFNVSSKYKIVPVDSLKAKVEYYITTKAPYIIDSIDVNIKSQVADSIYRSNMAKSLLKTNTPYFTDQLDAERSRITKDFRNKGLFHFERDFIKFEADTIRTNNKVNLTLNISNRPISNNDTTSQIPYKVHPISRVKIYTNDNFKNQIQKKLDSTYFNGFELYSYGKLKYKPKAITDVVFTVPGEIYKDSLRTITYNSLNNLGVFKYPTINFSEDPNDPNNEALIANILLTPRKKYAVGFDFDVSTSKIQEIGLGFGGSLLARNVFRRAETFEISVFSSIGSSAVADESDQLFNVSDLGVDAKLSFPRILFPFNIEKFIKKSSTPKTEITIGASRQKNIGLDKESVTGSFVYKWNPSKIFTNQIDALSLQYVRNLSPENYFSVYTNSYKTVNTIAQNILPEDSELLSSSDGNLIKENGITDRFINEALAGNYPDLSPDDIDNLKSVEERKQRLTEDNLILSTSYSFVNDTRSNLYDEDFSRFRFKVESAGLLLNATADLSNRVLNDNNSLELFGVEYSQFIKFESEYIKRWQIDKRNIIAIRGFGGIAIPYGNSNSVPFSQSYFGGGSNDLRAWVAYSLGPGTSGGENEFNEANFKLLFNAEYRFDVFGALKGALFLDGGNIWNVLDQFEDDESVSFSSFNDLKNLALGTGIGIRYDFDFFVLRLDTAWKLHNPDEDIKNQWFKELKFSKTVFNVGINYPF